ncbi:MAG: SDR family NAD(P)-dependent oxidoreductase, partial [Dehalococcoidia bacterium]
MRLAGKVAVITGAASGNGREIALRFAQEGADLVLPDVYYNGAEGVCTLLRLYGRRAIATQTDVSKKAEVNEMITTAVQEMGRIDIMVANAGIQIGRPFLELTEEEWDNVIDVNLKGVFLCGQAAARQMVAQGGGGCIINIASIMAEVGAAGAAAYAASKGGVVQLTKSMAIALAPHEIRVNAIAPGFIDTSMTEVLAAPLKRMIEERTPQERFGHPTDVANAAAFVASLDAGFMTGSVLTIDGGFTAGFFSAQAARTAATAAAERAAGPHPPAPSP